MPLCTGRRIVLTLLGINISPYWTLQNFGASSKILCGSENGGFGGSIKKRNFGFSTWLIFALSVPGVYKVDGLRGPEGGRWIAVELLRLKMSKTGLSRSKRILKKSN